MCPILVCNKQLLVQPAGSIQPNKYIYPIQIKPFHTKSIIPTYLNLMKQFHSFKSDVSLSNIVFTKYKIDDTDCSLYRTNVQSLVTENLLQGCAP